MEEAKLEEEVQTLADYTQFVKNMDPKLKIRFGGIHGSPMVCFQLGNIKQMYRMDSGNNIPKFVMDSHLKFMQDLALNHLKDPDAQEVIFGK